MMELLEARRQGQAEHHHRGRNRRRKNHAAQRAVGVHQRQRTHRHHRRRGRIAVEAAARGAPRNAAAQYRRPRRGPAARTAGQQLAYAARPHRGGRSPRRGSAGHAAGHEHRSRRLADHGPRQQPARRRFAPGSDGVAGQLEHAADLHPPADRQRGAPAGAGLASERRLAPRGFAHRSHRHGRRDRHAAGSVRVRKARPRSGRQSGGPFRGHRHPSQVLRKAAERRHPSARRTCSTKWWRSRTDELSIVDRCLVWARRDGGLVPGLQVRQVVRHGQDQSPAVRAPPKPKPRRRPRMPRGGRFGGAPGGRCRRTASRRCWWTSTGWVPKLTHISRAGRDRWPPARLVHLSLVLFYRRDSPSAWLLLPLGKPLAFLVALVAAAGIPWLYAMAQAQARG